MRLTGIEFTDAEQAFLRDLRNNVCDPRSCRECPYFYPSGLSDGTCMMTAFLSKLKNISNFKQWGIEEEEEASK